MRVFEVGDEVVFIHSGEFAIIHKIEYTTNWPNNGVKPLYTVQYHRRPYSGTKGYNIEESDLALVNDVHRLLYE